MRSTPLFSLPGESIPFDLANAVAQYYTRNRNSN